MSLITPDFGLLVWMVLIFGIVFFVLAKWGFPMITGMVDKRSDRIEQSIAKAREAEKSLSELSYRQEQLIEETRKEQARILKEATEARDQLLAAAQEQARDEASQLIQQARTQIAVEKESALRDIRSEVARLSVEVAEKVLRENLSSEEAQLSLIDRMVGEVTASKPS